jgi:hypothetical protein
MIDPAGFTSSSESIDLGTAENAANLAMRCPAGIHKMEKNEAGKLRCARCGKTIGQM